MTATQSNGASSAPIDFDHIKWHKIEKEVKRLQMRIAKAIKEERYGKAKALQRLLACSYYGKLTAVRRVTQNKGKRTPGVDGVVWRTPKQKMNAVQSLRRRGYKPQPLRRMYIPKKNGGRRPLSIPVMKCRAMQALHLLTLEPVSESLADENSYGFRPRRSTADAIEQCFITLGRTTSAQWIFEGDIRSCFDEIDHNWLLSNVTMDTGILQKWLKAGYIEDKSFFLSEEGTPQGGIVSPTLLVMTLRGLEQRIARLRTPANKVRIVVYADDFIVTGATKEVLEQEVQPAIARFLAERGLRLSENKTRITHIQEGFDFLGFNIRKYKQKLLIKPSKQSIHAFLNKIRMIIKTKPAISAKALIEILNPKIRGWALYYRSVVSKKVFSYVDACIFKALWVWIARRHPTKSTVWMKRKYFGSRGLRQWHFSTQGVKDDGPLDLLLASDVPIKRHIKIRGRAQPYDPQYRDYFAQRSQYKLRRVS